MAGLGGCRAYYTSVCTSDVVGHVGTGMLSWPVYGKEAVCDRAGVVRVWRGGRGQLILQSGGSGKNGRRSAVGEMGSASCGAGEQGAF